MIQRTVELCRLLGAGEDREDVLPVLAQAACEGLRRELRPGVTEQVCGDVFPMAAAMLALDALEELRGAGRVSQFTAGEVTIRCDGSGRLGRVARRMMAPWSRDGGFAVRGVRG